MNKLFLACLLAVHLVSDNVGAAFYETLKIRRSDEVLRIPSDDTDDEKEQKASTQGRAKIMQQRLRECGKKPRPVAVDLASITRDFVLTIVNDPLINALYDEDFPNSGNELVLFGCGSIKSPDKILDRLYALCEAGTLTEGMLNTFLRFFINYDDHAFCKQMARLGFETPYQINSARDDWEDEGDDDLSKVKKLIALGKNAAHSVAIRQHNHAMMMVEVYDNIDHSDEKKEAEAFAAVQNSLKPSMRSWGICKFEIFFQAAGIRAIEAHKKIMRTLVEAAIRDGVIADVWHTLFLEVHRREFDVREGDNAVNYYEEFYDLVCDNVGERYLTIIFDTVINDKKIDFCDADKITFLLQRCSFGPRKWDTLFQMILRSSLVSPQSIYSVIKAAKNLGCLSSILSTKTVDGESLVDIAMKNPNPMVLPITEAIVDSYNCESQEITERMLEVAGKVCRKLHAIAGREKSNLDDIEYLFHLLAGQAYDEISGLQNVIHDKKNLLQIMLTYEIRDKNILDRAARSWASDKNRFDYALRAVCEVFNYGEGI